LTQSILSRGGDRHASRRNKRCPTPSRARSAVRETLTAILHAGISRQPKSRGLPRCVHACMHVSRRHANPPCTYEWFWHSTWDISAACIHARHNPHRRLCRWVSPAGCEVGNDQLASLPLGGARERSPRREIEHLTRFAQCRRGDMSTPIVG
jgi:hypothetical protein